MLSQSRDVIDRVSYNDDFVQVIDYHLVTWFETIRLRVAHEHSERYMPAH